MDLKEQKSRGSQTIKTRHPWELARVQVVRDKLIPLLKKNQEAVIFDIGSGDTFVIETLADYFPKVTFYAIDIAFDFKLLQFYRKKHENSRINVFSTLKEAIKEVTYIDVVLLLDVVEHIEFDEEFLKSLLNYEQINKETKLLITVPAFQSLFISHDTFLGHYRRYTNKSLLSLIEKCGYHSNQTGYFFTLLLPIRILQYFKEKVIKPTKSTTGLVEWNGSKKKTNFIKKILLADYFTMKCFNKLGVKFPGLSNFIICQKSV